MMECSIEGCVKTANGSGWCPMHYQRSRRNGSPHIRSTKDRPTDAARFWSRVNKTLNCWLWIGARDTNGYGNFGMNNIVIKAHRVSYFFAYGEWPEPMCLHSCDNPSCVNPAHLRAGTHEENMQDGKDRRRFKDQLRHAELQNTAKLKETQVREIRRKYQAGNITIADLAREYGLGSSAMHSVVHGHTWKQVV